MLDRTGVGNRPVGQAVSCERNGAGSLFENRREYWIIRLPAPSDDFRLEPTPGPFIERVLEAGEVNAVDRRPARSGSSDPNDSITGVGAIFINTQGNDSKPSRVQIIKLPLVLVARDVVICNELGWPACLVQRRLCIEGKSIYDIHINLLLMLT
jgi:hypothetical protein